MCQGIVYCKKGHGTLYANNNKNKNNQLKKFPLWEMKVYIVLGPIVH